MQQPIELDTRAGAPAAPAAAPSIVARARGILRAYGPMLALGVMVLVNVLVTPNFLALGTLENTLVQVSSVMLVALGMTMVISSGGIDISVGSIMAIASAVSARLYTAEVGLVSSLACGVVAAAACGLLNATLISKFKIQPIIVTLVVMIAGRALSQIIAGQLFITLLYTPFGDFGHLRLFDVLPVQIVIMAAAIALVAWMARATVFAKYVEAIGENPRAARLVGIDTVKVLIGVYVLSSVLCAIAGNLEAARVNGVNVGSLGRNIELDAIAAVAIGGTSFTGGRARVLGTVIGAIVVQLVTVIVNMNNIPFAYSLLFKAVIVVMALWASKEGLMRSFFRSRGPLVALLVLCVAASIFFPTFLTTNNLANVFGQVGILGIVAIGMTFVILSGGIDLSVGSVAALASVVAAQMSKKAAFAALVSPTLVGLLVGFLNGILITRMGIPPFIATLAVMLGARGLVFLLSGGEPVPVDASAWFSQIARADLFGVPYLGIIFIVFLGVAIVVANRTSFGRSVYAIGGNEEAATMMGLGVNRTKMLVYMICGASAGTAGMLLASRLNSVQLNVAEGWELTAIGAVVVGGTSLTGGVGKMTNTLYGVLILGIIPNIINLEGTLDYWYSDLISGMLLLAVILLQSRVGAEARAQA